MLTLVKKQVRTNMVRMFSTESLPLQVGKIIQVNQVKAYKHNPEVNLIIRNSSPSEIKNVEQKELFQTLIRKTALGMFRNLNRKSKEVVKEAEDFMQYVKLKLDYSHSFILRKFTQKILMKILLNKLWPYKTCSEKK